jgi:hypothetical protein
MIGTGSRAGRGRRDQLAGCPPRCRMEVIMRIRRTVLAPAILAISATGALAVGPVLTVTTAAPAAVAVSAAKPNIMAYHG